MHVGSGTTGRCGLVPEPWKAVLKVPSPGSYRVGLPKILMRRLMRSFFDPRLEHVGIVAGGDSGLWPDYRPPVERLGMSEGVTTRIRS